MAEKPFDWGEIPSNLPVVDPKEEITVTMKNASQDQGQRDYFYFPNKFAPLSLAYLKMHNTESDRVLNINEKDAAGNFYLMIGWCYLVAQRNRAFSRLMECPRTQIIIATGALAKKDLQVLNAQRVIVVSLLSSTSSWNATINVFDFEPCSDYYASNIKISFTGNGFSESKDDYVSGADHWINRIWERKIMFDLGGVDDKLIIAHTVMCCVDLFSRLGTKIANLDVNDIIPTVSERVGIERKYYRGYVKSQFLPFVNQISYKKSKYSGDYGYPNNEVLNALGNLLNTDIKSKLLWGNINSEWFF